MNKNLRSILFAIIAQALWFGPAHAATSCGIQSFVGREAILHVGSRIIMILGWAHLDENSASILESDLKSIYEDAKTGSCDSAITTAPRILEKFHIALTNTQQVIEQISRADQRYSFTSIGIEMSPQELEEQKKQNIRINEVFSEFDKLCDSKLKNFADKIRILLPGPEFKIHRLNPSLSVEALEDQSLKDANNIDLAEVAKDRFNFSDPNFTRESKAALLAIRRDILSGAQPSEAVIQAACSFETNPIRKLIFEARLRQAIKRELRLVAGAFRRNVAIAANILRKSGNLVVPIGYNHVENLVHEILSQCPSN